MKFKLDGLGNIITLTVFTLLPIILFATILVLKLREGYIQEIEHLKTNNLQDFQSLNMCLTDLSSREFSVNRLHEEQHLCRLTMAKVSETMDHLSQALRDQMERHNVTKSKMIEQTGQLQSERTEKDNLTLELKTENLNLTKRVMELTRLVDNLTLVKSDLESKLGSVISDVDTLKSNTNRLEGEKKGLEKVLVVKEALQTIATSNSTMSKDDEVEEEEEEGDKSIKKILKGLETSPVLTAETKGTVGNEIGKVAPKDGPLAIPQTNPEDLDNHVGDADKQIAKDLPLAITQNNRPVQINHPPSEQMLQKTAVEPPELKPINKILKHLEKSPLLSVDDARTQA